MSVTMADLTHGTRVRHPYLDLSGTIRVAGDVTEVWWDEPAIARAASDRIGVIGSYDADDFEITGKCATSMADLIPGTRIRHIDTGTTGTICIHAGGMQLRWEQGPLAESRVGRVWPVSPAEIEIIGETP